MHEGPQVKILCTSQDNTQEVETDWLDACEVDEMQEAIGNAFAWIAGDDDDKAWEVLATEGFYNLANDIRNMEQLDEIEECAAAIAEHGEAYAAYADNIGTGYAHEAGFNEAYFGEWDSEQAYAEHVFDELEARAMPDHLKQYIDYAAYARDLFCGDYYSIESESGQEFIFRSC